MDSIKNLYYGSFQTSTESFYKNSEYHELLEIVSEQMHDLDERLSEQEKDDVNDIYELHNKLMCIAAEESYTSGFRDGAKLMLDILIGKNENLTSR